MLPGPENLRINRGEQGYFLTYQVHAPGRKTPRRVQRFASDEFELRAVLSELYG